MLVNNSLNEFVNKIGSTEPLPGGGSVAAYNGSLGVSLAKMVAILTVGKEAYAEFQELNNIAIEKSTKLVEDFQKLIDEDAQAYTDVLASYALPKDTEEKQTERFYKIQDSLKSATLIPLEVMELAVKGLEVVESLVGKSNKNAEGDLLVGSLNLNAALLGSHHNVVGNLGSVIDDVFRSIYTSRAEDLAITGKEIFDRIQKNLA